VVFRNKILMDKEVKKDIKNEKVKKNVRNEGLDIKNIIVERTRKRD